MLYCEAIETVLLYRRDCVIVLALPDCWDCALLRRAIVRRTFDVGVGLVSDGDNTNIGSAGRVFRAGRDSAGLEEHKVTVRKGDCLASTGQLKLLNPPKLLIFRKLGNLGVEMFLPGCIPGGGDNVREPGSFGG